MSKETRPTILIHNMETNEQEIREMNDEEFAAYEADQAAQATQAAVEAAKAAEKEALLARLGITADEAKLLLG
jgi:hypothetical protein